MCKDISLGFGKLFNNNNMVTKTTRISLNITVKCNFQNTTGSLNSHKQVVVVQLKISPATTKHGCI